MKSPTKITYRLDVKFQLGRIQHHARWHITEGYKKTLEFRRQLKAIDGYHTSKITRIEA